MTMKKMVIMRSVESARTTDAIQTMKYSCHLAADLVVKTEGRELAIERANGGVLAGTQAPIMVSNDTTNPTAEEEAREEAVIKCRVDVMMTRKMEGTIA